MLIRYASSRRHRIARRAIDLSLQVVILGGLFLAYRFGRLLVDRDPRDALKHARMVLRVQEWWMPLPSERAIQDFALNWLPGVRFANFFYIAVHFPATIAFLVWVWVRHRNHLWRVRRVMVALTASALLIHLVFPLAPPRLTRGYGFVDTGQLLGPSPYGKGLSTLANQFAAMPSLHIGWAVVIAWAVCRMVSAPWVRVAVLIHPAITTLVVIVTANHYWLDGFVAIALFFAAVLLTRPTSVLASAGRGVADAVVAGARHRRTDQVEDHPIDGAPALPMAAAASTGHELRSSA